MQRLLIIFSVFAVMLVIGAGVIYAQGPADGQGDCRGRGPGAGHLIDTIAEALEMEPADIIAQVQDEATLAEVIEANGGDVEAIKADLVAAATERINQAVEDGWLTQEEADEKLADLETHINDILNGEFEPRSGRGPGRGPRGGNAPDNAPNA